MSVGLVLWQGLVIIKPPALHLFNFFPRPSLRYPNFLGMGEFGPVSRDLTPVDFKDADNSTSLFLTSLNEEIADEKTTAEANCFTEEDYLNENSYRASQPQGCSATASETKRLGYLISTPSSSANSMFNDLAPGNLWSPPTPEDIHSQTMALSMAGNQIPYTSSHHFHSQKPRLPSSPMTTATNPQKRAISSYSFLPVTSPKPSSNIGWNFTPAHHGQAMSGWQHFPTTAPTWGQYHPSSSSYMTNQVSAIGQRNGLGTMNNGRPAFPSSNRFPRGQRNTNNGFHGSRSVCTASVTQSLQGMNLGERPIDGTVVSDLGIPGISGNLTELSNSLYMV